MWISGISVAILGITKANIRQWRANRDNNEDGW